MYYVIKFVDHEDGDDVRFVIHQRWLRSLGGGQFHAFWKNVTCTDDCLNGRDPNSLKGAWHPCRLVVTNPFTLWREALEVKNSILTTDAIVEEDRRTREEALEHSQTGRRRRIASARVRASEVCSDDEEIQSQSKRRKGNSKKRREVNEQALEKPSLPNLENISTVKADIHAPRDESTGEEIDEVPFIPDMTDANNKEEDGNDVANAEVDEAKASTEADSGEVSCKLSSVSPSSLPVAKQRAPSTFSTPRAPKTTTPRSKCSSQGTPSTLGTPTNTKSIREEQRRGGEETDSGEGSFSLSSVSASPSNTKSIREEQRRGGEETDSGEGSFSLSSVSAWPSSLPGASPRTLSTFSTPRAPKPTTPRSKSSSQGTPTNTKSIRKMQRSREEETDSGEESSSLSSVSASPSSLPGATQRTQSTFSNPRAPKPTTPSSKSSSQCTPSSLGTPTNTKSIREMKRSRGEETGGFSRQHQECDSFCPRCGFTAPPLSVNLTPLSLELIVTRVKDTVLQILPDLIKSANQKLLDEVDQEKNIDTVLRKMKEVLPRKVTSMDEFDNLEEALQDGKNRARLTEGLIKLHPATKAKTLIRNCLREVTSSKVLEGFTFKGAKGNKRSFIGTMLYKVLFDTGIKGLPAKHNQSGWKENDAVAINAAVEAVIKNARYAADGSVGEAGASKTKGQSAVLNVQSAKGKGQKEKVKRRQEVEEEDTSVPLMGPKGAGVQVKETDKQFNESDDSDMDKNFNPEDEYISGSCSE